MATLLLIDDDRAVREMLELLFSETHECHTADRAEQALEYLEFQPYDAVITDISMPGVSGVEIVRRIHERHPSTPVIVISGRADEYRESLIEMGIFACFAKPFSLDELEGAVNKALADRGQVIEDPACEQLV